MKLKLKSILATAGLLLFVIPIFSQTKNLPKLNGYIQTRLSTDFDKSTEFTIRRAKLWVYGDVPKAEYISYKIQMVYRSFKDETLMFQDAYADIQLKDYGTICVGRFVPDFMLQRKQPDYEIPIMERAKVENSLVHNEKQMARETGLQYLIGAGSQPLHFSFGVFNANVDRPEHSKNNLLLYTSRLNYKIVNIQNTELTIGGSVAFRRLDNTSLTTIYNPDTLLSGSDFRWGLEAQLRLNNFKLQGEYVQANINSNDADGWYTLATWSFTGKYQVAAFAEKYTDLNPVTNDSPLYGMGLNYLITDKTKIMTDIKTRKSGNKYSYTGDIQFQLFFN
jgi:phosphate-selective porin